MSSHGKPVGLRASGLNQRVHRYLSLFPSECDGKARLEVYSAFNFEQMFGHHHGWPGLHTPVLLPLPTKVVMSTASLYYVMLV